MARPEFEIILRVDALAGLAECLVCGALVSSRLAFAEIDERINELRCPRCKGSCMPDECTLVLIISTEAAHV